MSLLHNAIAAAAGSGAEYNGVSSKIYVDDVFSTYLYTGNGSTQTINNGIDLAGRGGMVWVKNRGVATDHALHDSTMPNSYYLSTNQTYQRQAGSTNSNIINFTSGGFNVGITDNMNVNVSANTYVSWTFRKAPKFFDVVTYTGTGVARTISHSLGQAPGMIIIKRTDTSGNAWYVYHRALGATKIIYLNQTDAAATATSPWNDTDPTSSVFTVGVNNNNNASGGTYVAYLFAHDPSADGIIQCGSYSGNSGSQTVNIGFEPQFLVVKSASGTNAEYGEWGLIDVMRGMPVGSNVQRLKANSSDPESAESNLSFYPTATGFGIVDSSGSNTNFNRSGITYIYLAIRRPNKPPTSGSEVFSPNTTAGTGVVVNTGFPVDLNIHAFRSGNINSQAFVDRLRGVVTTATQAGSPTLKSSSTDAENTGIATLSWNNSGFTTPSTSGISLAHWSFKRAKGFFDIVAYTATNESTGNTISHGLGVTPELCIFASRGGSYKWFVPSMYVDATYAKALKLDASGGADTRATISGITSTSISFPPYSVCNNEYGAPNTYIAYLFASLPNVSKVGSYTGNGTSQTINCGFSTGARFILIKRTDSTGDWYVWDTARGIVSANDPHLSLNTTAAEVTTDDSVDPEATGFIVNQNTATNINVSGGSYIFLAIA